MKQREPVRVIVPAPAEPTTMSLMLEEARAGEAVQLQLASTLDQRGGVLLGFAGLLVTVIVGQGLGWYGVAAAGIAGSAGALAGWSLMRWPTDRVDPAALVEVYSAVDHAEVEATVARTSAAAYTARAQALREKRRPLGWAVLLLLASVAVLLVGVTVDVASQTVSNPATIEATPSGGGAKP